MSVFDVLRRSILASLTLLPTVTARAGAQPATPLFSAAQPLPASLVAFCQAPDALPASATGLAVATQAWHAATQQDAWPTLPPVTIAPQSIPDHVEAEASLSPAGAGRYVLRTHHSRVSRATVLHELVHAALDAAPPAAITATVTALETLSAQEPARVAHAMVGALSSIQTTFGDEDPRASGPLQQFIVHGLAYLSAVNDRGHAYRAFQIRDTTRAVPATPVSVATVLAWIEEATRHPHRPMTRALEAFAAPRRAHRSDAGHRAWTASDEGALIFVSEVLAYAIGDQCLAARRQASALHDRGH